MSSDTSPSSGLRLDNPARTAGATGATGATGPTGVTGGAAPRHQSSAAPSWIKVIATTLRLWVRRRVLRVPDTGRIGRARLTGVTAAIVVVAVAAAVAVLVAVNRSPASQAAQKHAVTAPRLTPAQKHALTVAAAQTAANVTAAAAWIAAEVSQREVIGCDPVTCAAIRTAVYGSGGQVVLQPGVRLPAAGYGSGGQVVLQPGRRLPAAGSVVVDTPAVRAQYGATLPAAAPALIAAFGTGPQAVQVRVVMPGGQAAYSQTVSTAIAARRAAGLSLLADSNVHERTDAQAALTGGQVDPRLLTVLHKVAAQYPITINGFSDAGPLADSSVPFRAAEIVGLTATHARHQTSQLAAVEQLLQDQPAADEPALTPVLLWTGKYGLIIQFPAPSPA